MVCPEHGEPLVKKELAGESYRECALCHLAVIPRAALNRLRDRAASPAPPAFPEAAAASPGAAPSAAAWKRRCPECQNKLLSHAFGGGNVRVQTCEPCELVILGRAEISAILKEARDGIEMSDGAHEVLHHQRMLAAGDRHLAAELGLGTVVLGATLAFFRISLKTGFSTVLMAVAGVAAIGTVVYARHTLRKKKAEAEAKMERLAEAELFRQKQKPTSPSSPPPAPTSAPRPPPGPALDSPSPPAALASSASPRAGKPRLCPVCRAPLPASTTHCSSCDSDFG